MTMTTQILSCLTFPLQLPASANVPFNNSALSTLSPAGGDPVRNVQCLQPMPNQTGLHLRQLQNPHSVPGVLGPQGAVQLVTQRTREALHDRRETARRAPLHQQGIVFCCHSSVWSGWETKPCQHFGRQQWSAQLQRADARLGNSKKKQARDLHKDRRNCHLDFLKKQIKLLKTSEKNW